MDTLRKFLPPPGADYRIGLMTAAHVDRVSALERLCFTSPWSKALLAAQLGRNDVCYLVAERPETGQILGCAGLQVVLDEGSIDNVAVHPDCRRSGIAKALVTPFLRYAEARLAFLTLEVRASNEAAIGLYTVLGFAQVGRRKNYYFNPKEDAILMTRRFAFEAIEADAPATAGGL